MSLPPHHAWTHRPKAQGGTDPIESGAEPVSAFANSYPASLSHTGFTALTFNELWRSPGSPYTADTGNEASYTYIDIGQDGWYLADFTVFVSSNLFDAGDNPFIEASSHVGLFDGDLQSAVYPTWNNEQGWIGGEQLNAEEMTHQQWVSRVWFNYVAADVDPSFGIGVNLRSAGSETLTIGGWVVVTRLGDALEEVP